MQQWTSYGDHAIMRFNPDSELLKGFNSQRTEARLYVNDSPTAVELSYESANERTTDTSRTYSSIP
jgi:hypothetical protein